MQTFFRYPHTPHLSWLGSGAPRSDKVLSPLEVQQALGQALILEEKLDGANLGISLDGQGNIQVQNRGSILQKPFSGQFSRVASWLDNSRSGIEKVLTDDLILFGEWCAATHSLRYSALPDWFLLFDVYSRKANAFWSTSRRNNLAYAAGLKHVPLIGRGKFSLGDLTEILRCENSRFGDGPMEGLILRSENEYFCTFKAKLVRAEFIQSIDEHWSAKGLRWNSVSH